MVTLATQTLAAIESAIQKDGGALFRTLEREEFAKLEDAFSSKEESFRTHLGASLIGRPCARELWYNFHWATKPDFSPRLLRLFNRGHLEEARFIALLRMVCTKVWTQTEDGNQFRIHGGDGHFGGSLDAVIEGCPDYPQTPILGEFKTHNNKSFVNLKEEGVQRAKWEHYVQQNIYMAGYQLPASLYLAVNKDTDELYGEIVLFNAEVSSRYHARAKGIIDSPEPVDRINSNPSWYQCKFCDHQKLCHDFAYPEVNCRTCTHSTPVSGGWHCELKNFQIPKNCSACPDHLYNPTMLNKIEVLSADAGKNQMLYKRADGTKILAGTGAASSQELRGV